MEDEIDLRLYAQVVWRARYAILGVTLGAALLAFGISRFLLPPVYQASALVVVAESPAPEGPAAGEAQGDALAQGAGARAPVPAVRLAPAAYAEIVDSDSFRARLGARAADGGGAGAAAAPRPVVRARVVGQTDLIELTAEAPRADLAARWANEAAALLADEVARLNQSRMERSLSLLQEQVEASRQALDQALARMESLAREGPLLEQLEGQQSVQLQMAADYRRRLDEIEVQLASGRARLEVLQRRLASEPRTLPLQAGTGPGGGSPGEAFNPVYAQLQEEATLQQAALAGLEAERARLQEGLQRLEDELQATAARLVQVRADRQEVAWQLDVAQRNYQAALARYEAQRAELAGRLWAQTLSVVREAVPPAAPARPRALLNAAVAGFLGLMVGLFGALAAEMWRQPGPGQAAVPASGAAGPAR